MVITEFLNSIIGLSPDFSIQEINHNEQNKEIDIHIKYISKTFNKEGKEYRLYDLSPQRRWQHLNWFEYKCFVACKLPRYITDDGKVKVIEVNFASKSKGYTHKFRREILQTRA